MASRVAELEAQLAAKPAIDRATLYRITDNAPWGILAVNGDGDADYTNPAFQRWLTNPEPAAGDCWTEIVGEPLLAILEAPLAAALGGQPYQAELSVRDVSGQARAVRLFVVPRGGGASAVNGAVISLYDVTENQTLDRTVRENEARLSHINAVSPTANYIFDHVGGGPAWLDGRAEGVFGYAVEELLAGGGELFRKLIHVDDFHHVATRLKRLTAGPDGDVREFEVRIRRRDGGYRWVLDRAVAFERNADGRVIKTLSSALDIDERKRAEDRRTLLINELNHRVKNTLVSVQSIARQTLRSSHTPQQMTEIFTGRLVALASAHDVLTRENWEGAGLKKVVDAALAPFGDARISRAGPDARLDARAALALSMALHELATNALKYGALSNEKGVVRLTWQIREGAAAPILTLEWREQDGPLVIAPKRRGFGSRLLTQGMRREFSGGAELEFAPTGVVCRITAALEATPLLELI
ncbi:MAG TPA: HWE histidine kinase domain-containing protein [Phenylobacterium sp.]